LAKTGEGRVVRRWLLATFQGAVVTIVIILIMVGIHIPTHFSWQELSAGVFLLLIILTAMCHRLDDPEEP
jgi:hypothetical protein